MSSVLTDKRLIEKLVKLSEKADRYMEENMVIAEQILKFINKVCNNPAVISDEKI